MATINLSSETEFSADFEVSIDDSVERLRLTLVGSGFIYGPEQMLLAGTVDTVDMVYQDPETGAELGSFHLIGVDAYGADLLDGVETHFDIVEFASGPFQLELDYFAQYRNTEPVMNGVLSLAGEAKVLGGKADDLLVSYTDAKLISGRAGDDMLLSYADRTQLKGGSGADVIDYAGFGRGRLVGGGGEDTLLATGHEVRLLGGKDGDFLQIFTSPFVENAISRLSGQAGNDTIFGHSGADLIRGGGGDDLITGDTGKDTLVGGNGADVFTFVMEQYLLGPVTQQKVIIRDFDPEEDSFWLFSGPLRTDAYTVQDAFDVFMDNARQAGSSVIVEDAQIELVLLGLDLNTLGVDNFEHDLSF